MVYIGKRIVLVVGESGSGKDTLVNAVCKKYGYKKLISYTTRPMRNNMNDRNSHIFVTDDEFSNLKNIVAYTEFDGYKYCATQEQVDQSDFYIIDCEGVKYFKEHYDGSKDIVTVHINVSKVDRFLRMKKHDDTVEAMNRIIHDTKAFSEVDDLCDLTINNINKDMTNAIKTLRDVMEGRLSMICE